MTDLKTDQLLLDRIRKAATHVPTEDEVRNQRISFVMGALDKGTKVTRSLVEEVLGKQEGRKAS